MLWFLLGLGAFIGLVAIYDLLQRKHAILRNFPVIGHLRYILETIGPELRQYIVTSNDEERPFTRDQRSWVYASAKRQNNYAGFGTDNNLDLAREYIIFRHAAFPKDTGHLDDHLPCAKVMGGHRKRRKAFRPNSVINISAMSYGSLSAPATSAINHGCRLAGCLHNTGEGGIAKYHDHGGELIWQIGTGYFGCRDKNGNFDINKLIETCQRYPVKALEVKLSQGAKPGKGGVLPGEKVTAEISKVRGIPQGKDCLSPSGHTAFRDVDSMLDFVEHLAGATGLPVGIKSAVGQMDFWVELADLMAKGGRAVDFIAIDGGEGGTGAAPLVFADHVAVPFRVAMQRVYRVFAERNVHDQVVFMGAGRLGFPESALHAMALGADMVYVAREAMMAIGCIQAQRCHTGHCPTGVATQNRWLMRGLDPTSKAARLANYVATLREEMLQLCHACGVDHPSLLTLDHIEILNEGNVTPGRQYYNYPAEWHAPMEARADELNKLMHSSH